MDARPWGSSDDLLRATLTTYMEVSQNCSRCREWVCARLRAFARVCARENNIIKKIVCLRVCLRACIRSCMRACMCACVPACVHAHVLVRMRTCVHVMGALCACMHHDHDLSYQVVGITGFVRVDLIFHATVVVNSRSVSRCAFAVVAFGAMCLVIILWILRCKKWYLKWLLRE